MACYTCGVVSAVTCHVARSVVWNTQWRQVQLMRVHGPEETVWQERGAVLSWFEPSCFCCRSNACARTFSRFLLFLPLKMHLDLGFAQQLTHLRPFPLSLLLHDKGNLSVQSEYELYLASDRPLSIWFEEFSLNASKQIGTVVFLKSWTSTGYLANSTSSSAPS